MDVPVNVAQFIKSAIEQSPSKMIPYDQYIQLALYHPHGGYYMKEQLKVGRQGDFITTSNIGDVYGALMAKWVFQLVESNVIEPAFCELGAGTGRFAHAFLEAWHQLCDQPIQYFICEKSPYHQELYKIVLANYEFTHLQTIEDLKEFKGMVFSNELFDALPVRVINRQDDELVEVMITLEEENLTETFIPITDEAIVEFLQHYQIDLVNHQRYEVPLAAIKEIQKIGACLEQGIVISVDYGYTNDEWQEDAHKEGSLRGYRKHQLLRNVLLYPGEIDITSHVHWDVLRRAGEEVGLDPDKLIRQDEFFLNLGILELLQDHYDPNPFSEQSKKNRAIRSLIMPEGLSSHFQVLVQAKGVSLPVF